MSNNVFLYLSSVENFRRSSINYQNKERGGSIKLTQFATETYLEFYRYFIQFETNGQILGYYVDHKLLQIQNFVSNKNYFVYLYVIDESVYVDLKESYEASSLVHLQKLIGIISDNVFELIEGT